MTTRQCISCGGFCKKSGCELANSVIAQPVRQSPHHEYDKGFSDGWNKCEERQALAQPEQGPVALETVYETIIQWDEGGGKRSRRELARRITALCTSPPQRQPLTHEQRLDLLTAFEEHKHEWHAHAILIDMVEAAHNIKEQNK